MAETKICRYCYTTGTLHRCIACWDYACGKDYKKCCSACIDCYPGVCKECNPLDRLSLPVHTGSAEGTDPS